MRAFPHLTALFIACLLQAATGLTARAQANFEVEIRPLLNRYCVDCHGGKKTEGGMNFAKVGPAPAVMTLRKLWSEAHHVLRTEDMPPDDKPQPSLAERKRLLIWLEQTLERIDASTPLNAGRSVMRRLTRFEYKNTLRDLLGVEFSYQFDPTTDFPADAADAGFDTNGAVLSMSQGHLEQYFAAAGQILEKAVGSDGGKTEPSKGKKNKQDKPPAVLQEGRKTIFTTLPGPGKSREQAASEVLTEFARRAFRRPVTPEEMARYGALFKVSDAPELSFEKAMIPVLQAILVSPHFLFRVEPDRPARLQDGGYAVNAYELATRLSYFLWSSMPDDALFASAASGRLLETAELDRQARRMLADPKASALAENFATQWLAIRSVESFTPDKKRYGELGTALRKALLREPVMLFRSIMEEKRSLLTLLDADYTFVNEDLAKIYKIDLPPMPPEEAKKTHSREQLRRVALTPEMHRGGVMTMSAVLMASSNPNRTSLVKRGKWVLDNLLGTPPPPPDPNVASLPEQTGSGQKLSLRQQVEQHRAQVQCAACHKRMDPIGFALENYDVMGRWRDKDDTNKAIDTSGELSDGTKISGPDDLKKTLLARKAEFATCLAEKLLTYGLGRSPEPYDRRAITGLINALAPGGYKLDELIVGLVKSYPFRNRRLAVGEQTNPALPKL